MGFWEGNVAVGFAAEGVLARNVFGGGERLAVSGGVGFSTNEDSFGNHSSQSSIGGRAGGQLTW